MTDPTRVSIEPNRVPLSPLSFLVRGAETHPADVAVVDGVGEEIAFEHFLAYAEGLAGALRSAGIGDGDRVAVLAGNDLPLLAAHYAVPGAGAVLVALNTRLGTAEYSHILRHSNARLLIADAALLQSLDGAQGLLDEVPTVVLIGSTDAGRADYETWRQTSTPVPLKLPASEDDAIAINYTSGTTGPPKGVVYTHRGAYLAALSQVIGFGLDRSSRYLWTLPMFHCNGWCFTWAVTAAGARHVCLPTFEARRALELIDSHGITHLCGAPVVLTMLAAEPMSSPGRTREVRVATGGAAPSPTVISRMSNIGMSVTHLYGLTETYGPSLICETQPTWAGLSEEELARRFARQGLRTLAVEGVRVVDEMMRDVARDGTTMGEIVIRSNTVMARYHDDPAATAAATAGGWFHTGDIAVMHPDNYVEVRDRAKDIIISGGENIASIEVEHTLAAHPAVEEAAVVGRPDERWGEVPVAFVLLREGAAASVEDLDAWVRSRIARFKAPKAYRFEELPKTPTGKVRKNELRKRALEVKNET